MNVGEFCRGTNASIHPSQPIYAADSNAEGPALQLTLKDVPTGREVSAGTTYARGDDSVRGAGAARERCPGVEGRTL
jgi:hypothetical protein